MHHNDLRPPIIGVTCDIADDRARCSLQYLRALAPRTSSNAGAIPVLLACADEARAETLARQHAEAFDGFVLTGGDDPAMEAFGKPTHPAATRMHPARQAYELALLRTLRERYPAKPVMGICLGMQLMALDAGGSLHQHLPDTLDSHADHADDRRHTVLRIVDDAPIGEGAVTSRHHQAVKDPGSMRTIAVAHDGVIEAIDDPGRPFYLGVQWHPERTDDPALGRFLFDSFVETVAYSLR